MAVEQAMDERANPADSAGAIDWDRVYAEQLPRVYNFFRFRLADQADVEDLTSKTFERAWQSRDRYRKDIAGFSTWLFTIARNVAIDHFRTARSHLPLEVADDVPVDGTPEHVVSQESDVERLVRLTADLPERERELLALKYGAAISNRMIAELTSLTESNVGTILSRTVVQLRARW